MKLKILLFWSGTSLLINLFSLYNIGIAYISFFFFVHLFILRVYIKLISYWEELEADETNAVTKFLTAFGHHPVVRLLNWLSVTISLVIFGIVSIIMIVTQLFLKKYMVEFLTIKLQAAFIHPVAEVLSYLGYPVYLIALVLVIKDSIHILRKETLFQI